MSYIAVGIVTLNIAADSAEQQAAEQQVQAEGIDLLHKQPGFIRIRMAHLTNHSLMMIWEWASAEQATAGWERWDAWKQQSGLQSTIVSVESYAGHVIVKS